MADNLSPEKRSKLMSKISGRETKPEIIVRKFIFSQGYRFRKNVKTLPGTPDIVLPKYKTVIFVHGCFWHGHEGCRAARLPSTNYEYWHNKRKENLERDRRKESELRKLGWKIIIIWECEIKKKMTIEKTLNRLLEWINN